MANHLEQTWLAYAFNEAPSEDDLRERFRRVRDHTQTLFSEELIEERAAGQSLGLGLWRREDPRLRADLFHRDSELVAATTSALGASDLRDAARALLSAPGEAATFNPPFALGVLDAPQRRLVVVNDVIGTGRLFTLESGAGRIWSNRIGALVAFAGERPAIDRRAWEVLAATGWFLGETTAFERIRQLRGATIVEATAQGDRVTVTETRNLAALEALVRPRRTDLRESARSAASGARELAEGVAANWDCPIRVDLSGGRDSRVSAAAAVACGVSAELRTSDLEHGEVDLVRDLVRAAPRPVDFGVQQPEREPEDSLAERLAAIHLVHDGMRNPQSLLRTSMPIPHGPLERPVLSGHGGELGHGFYYASTAELRRLRFGRRDALLERLGQAARKNHGAAHESAYEVYLDEAAKTLAEGRELGLRGPALLDYYYLAQRLANRSGLTTRNDRWSACSTPAFIRACFDLKPKERLESRLHRLVVAELLPEWADAPYYERPTDAPSTKRLRIWEKPGHREELGRIIDSDESWHGLFEPDAVKRAWRSALEGDVHPHWESVFTRIIWRSTFERHAERLKRAARATAA
jgi:hypothetical protein